MGRRKSPYFSVHTHSAHSSLDGMTKPAELVAQAEHYGMPGISSTEHGNMASVVQYYKAAKENGLKYFPGIEAYLIDPRVDDWENPPKGTKVGRYHFGLMALNEDGYKALVKFTSLTHTRPRFNRFPRCTLQDLAQLGKAHGEDIVITTGCYFGLIQQTLVHEGIDAARKGVEMLANWFPNTYVEVQHHNIFHTDEPDILPQFQSDDDIVEALFDIADELDLPVVAGQDSHYTYVDEKQAHNLMKQMVYSGTDDEFPGDSFHLASWEWVAEHYTDEQWERIEDGHQQLLDSWDVKITPLDNYHPDVPHVMDNPEKYIRDHCIDRLGDYIDDNKIEDEEPYFERLEYELDVINQLNMASYFVVVRDYVEWCEDEQIMVEARGSANGSLACFLLGITQVDSVYYDIPFERFLSTDRIHPPDIDMDIEDSERGRLVEYLLSKYKAVQIGTFSSLGITVDEETGEEKGSILVTYLSSKRRECQELGAEKLEAKHRAEGKKPPTKADSNAYGMAIFNRIYGEVKTLEDVRDISPEDYEGLWQINDMNSVKRSYGVHAGGILLSGEHIKIEDYIPTMLVASSNTRVTQFDMDDVEEFGLLKMDILGQTTLRTIRLAQEFAGRKDPLDLSWIPMDDPDAGKIMREGRTNNGIFHLEAYTKSKGAAKMKAQTTMDAIHAMALFMPGAMNSGQTDLYLERRRSPSKRRAVKYSHPAFEKALSDTYGTLIFQEQVLTIMRELGMDPVGVNTFFKIVKDSGKGSGERNAERLEKSKAEYEHLAKEAGMSKKDAAEGWELITGMAAYAFNKAHATGYGIRAYRTAYLKSRFPLEYMTALLIANAGKKVGKVDKEQLYSREARIQGLAILPPDINVSGADWSIDRKHKAIRRGLATISGIGYTTARAIEEGQPYESIEDMVERLPGRALTGGKKFIETGELSGNIGKLHESGVLDTLLE